MANLYTQAQNLNYFLFDVEYCGRLFRVPINSKEFETRIKQDATLRLEFVKKVKAKIAENDPKFLSFEIIREGEATKLKLVPSTSGSNRALSPMPKAAQANNHIDKKRSAIPRNNLVPIAIRTEAPVNEEINGQSNSGAAAVAGTAGAGVQRWTFDEVSTLLECYAIYEPRFSKKMERTATLWEKVNKEMEKRGVKTTAERCSVKFAAMKKRFNELNDQNVDGEKGRRVQWPFFSKMNELLGLSDASTLKHVHGVGADSSKMRDDDSNPSTPPPPKKSRARNARITHPESISRLIEIEMDRSSMDQEFLKEIRASNAASLTKTEAIVSASKAFEKLANGMLNKFQNMQGVVSSEMSVIHQTEEVD